MAAPAEVAATAASPPKGALDEAMERAHKTAYRTDSYSDHATFEFVAVWDHILPTTCRHSAESPIDSPIEEDGSPCSICLFEKELSALPQLPEMIFPRNELCVRWRGHPGASLTFRALDALKGVDTTSLPGIQVAPSAVWQESRSHMGEFRQFSRPFDWTYTTPYAGTPEGLHAEDTTDTVDLERLKRQEPILFYAQVPLYEDELADHGAAQVNARIRVMPSSFFLLQRFYLRVDNVLTRVCDTRVFAERGSNSVLVEWTFREAPASALASLPHDVALDPNQVWQHLPVTQQRSTRYTPITNSSTPS